MYRDSSPNGNAATTDIRVAAIEAADIGLMTDEWLQVPAAIRLARSTFRTIKQNLFFIARLQLRRYCLGLPRHIAAHCSCCGAVSARCSYPFEFLSPATILPPNRRPVV